MISTSSPGFHEDSRRPPLLSFVGVESTEPACHRCSVLACRLTVFPGPDAAVLHVSPDTPPIDRQDRLPPDVGPVDHPQAGRCICRAVFWAVGGGRLGWTGAPEPLDLSWPHKPNFARLNLHEHHRTRCRTFRRQARPCGVPLDFSGGDEAPVRSSAQLPATSTAPATTPGQHLIRGSHGSRPAPGRTVSPRSDHIRTSGQGHTEATDVTSLRQMQNLRPGEDRAGPFFCAIKGQHVHCANRPSQFLVV